MITIEEQIRRLADMAEAAEPEQCRRPGGRPRGAVLAVVGAIGVLVGGAVWGLVALSTEPDLAVTASSSAGTSEPDGSAAPPPTEAWEEEQSYRVVEADLSVSPDETTVDVGAEDGVQPGVGVYGGGLVGVVAEVRATSSTVRLLGFDDLAVRATVTYADPLGGDYSSGFSTIEGTVRTIDETVVFTADGELADDLASRLAGLQVVVGGGPGSLLQGKVPIGTIERPISIDDPSTFVLQLDEAHSDGEVTIILPATTFSDRAVRLQRIEARNGPSGTERVAVSFDRPLPSDEVIHVTDLASHVEGVVSYTTQGPAAFLSICGAGHGGFGTEGVATVDLLIPAAWFDPEHDVEHHAVTPDGTGGEEYFDQIGKIIVCPAIDGVVQVSVTHPASVSAANLDVYIDGNTLVLEAAPE